MNKSNKTQNWDANPEIIIQCAYLRMWERYARNAKEHNCCKIWYFQKLSKFLGSIDNDADVPYDRGLPTHVEAR